MAGELYFFIISLFFQFYIIYSLTFYSFSGFVLFCSQITSLQIASAIFIGLKFSNNSDPLLLKVNHFFLFWQIFSILVTKFYF